MSKRPGVVTAGAVTTSQRPGLVEAPASTTQQGEGVAPATPANSQRRTGEGAAGAAPAKRRTVADSIVEDLRMFGGSLRALADLLPLSEENAEWLRSQRLAETAADVHVRARVDSELMRDRGIDPPQRVAVLATLHYGGFASDFTARIVSGDAGAKINARADSMLEWIRGSPRRLAKSLARLPQIYLR